MFKSGRKVISVILCGGAGARLWPLSRKLYPKPFIRLKDGESFLRKAIVLGGGAPESDGIKVITNREFFFKTLEDYQFSKINKKASYILEPFGRNTAPAIAIAALQVSREHGEDTPILVLPSDHLIDNRQEFYRCVSRALKLAADNRLVTFGIVPAFPHTGYGYIEADGERVVQFVEKPSLDKAAEYVDSGKFLWNSGMFCFRAGVMLAEMRRYCPEVVQKTEECLAVSPPGMENSVELDEETFAEAPDISIDYAVFEHSDNVAVVRCEDIGWSDIGTWTELCKLTDVDAAGNHVKFPEQSVLHDTANCDIDNYSRLVATLGLKDILIIDTDDALLVADKSRAQDVKIIYERLKEEGHATHLHHRTIHRPWGYYTILEEGARFKTKRMVLKPGAQISLQRHHHRSEHWIVVSGMAEVTRGEDVFFVNTNESTYIKAGEVHRVANPGRVDLAIIEVQSGDYLGEDDIVRVDDIYGRS